MMINSGLLLGIFLIFELFKNCIFTGVPFMNKECSRKQDIVRNVSIFWIYGKLIDLVLYGFLLVSSLVLKDSVEDILTQNNITGIIFFVCYSLELIFNEIVPSFLVFDRQYFRSFELSRVNDAKESFLDEDEEQFIGKEQFQNGTTNGVSIYERKPEFLESGNYKKNESLRKMSDEEIVGMFGTIQNDSVDITNKKTKFNADISTDSRYNTSFEKSYWKALGVNNLKVEDLNLNEDVVFDTLKGRKLGKCFLGTFKGYNIKAREIGLKNLSSFMIRQIPLEIRKWKRVNEEKIEHPLGYIVNDSQTWLITQYSSGFIPLHKFIQEKFTILTHKDKLRISLLISTVMSNLFRMDASLSHGHLCPQNIMIEELGTDIRITDFGFTFLRKYCSLLNQYSNKDQFTAPEILKQKGRVSTKHNEASDVYSFGMVLWYIFSGVFPLDGLECEEIKRLIVEKKSRPKIEENMQKGVRNLIRACWQTEPSLRPSFYDINDALTRIALGDSGWKISSGYRENE